MLVEAANYQVKKELVKKGGHLAMINLESRVALLAAKQNQTATVVGNGLDDGVRGFTGKSVLGEGDETAAYKFLCCFKNNSRKNKATWCNMKCKIDLMVHKG
ncbi:hypothetical protein A2U01_0012233 [Trifolium medium]|uniref:Uncharacterized protein n=1 Tax=Trifolium medium TaxID=97028 RepID=A0A392MUT8_9FABA|nr:hypothetical protein [Trifolium medium]